MVVTLLLFRRGIVPTSLQQVSLLGKRFPSSRHMPHVNDLIPFCDKYWLANLPTSAVCLSRSMSNCVNVSNSCFRA